MGAGGGSSSSTEISSTKIQENARVYALPMQRSLTRSLARPPGDLEGKFQRGTVRREEPHKVKRAVLRGTGHGGT